MGGVQFSCNIDLSQPKWLFHGPTSPVNLWSDSETSIWVIHVKIIFISRAVWGSRNFVLYNPFMDKTQYEHVSKQTDTVAAQRASASPAFETRGPVVSGQRVKHWGNLSFEFGAVTAYFCSPSTSPHINQTPPPPPPPWEEAFLGLQTVASKTTQTNAHTNSHNRTLKYGFPIAPAHTK